MARGCSRTEVTIKYRLSSLDIRNGFFEYSILLRVDTYKKPLSNSSPTGTPIARVIKITNPVVHLFTRELV